MTGRRLAALGIVLALSGCAAAPAGLDLRLPPAPNPSAGEAFRITVVDRRRVEAAPAAASVPSTDGADAAVLPRVVGRTAGAGPLLLAEDAPAVRVARDVLTNALRAEGYRVPSDGDADAAAATPLTAELEKLWTWSVVVPPEPVALHYYECDIAIRLGAGWPLAEPDLGALRGNEWMFKPDAADAHWPAILGECLGELDYVLRAALRKPRGG